MHVASILQHNTRRGDWLARWEPDTFIVGLHRNRAPKIVTDRILHAFAASPCEIVAGKEITLSVSVGAAEYRFGSGKAGLLADADRALQPAIILAGTHGGSHACYFHEVATGTTVNHTVAA